MLSDDAPNSGSIVVWANILASCMQLAAAAFKRLSPAYTVAFVIVRTLIGPPAITWLARRLVLTDRLPFALRCGYGPSLLCV